MYSFKNSIGINGAYIVLRVCMLSIKRIGSYGHILVLLVDIKSIFSIPPFFLRLFINILSGFVSIFISKKGKKDF